MSKARQRHEALLVALHREMTAGRRDGERADAIGDEMNALWHDLDDEERDLFDELSEDLYLIEGKRRVVPLNEGETIASVRERMALALGEQRARDALVLARKLPDLGAGLVEAIGACWERLADLDLSLAGVIGPHPVGDDHVTERDLPAPARAHAAHREAADLVGGDELRARAHGLDAAHPPPAATNGRTLISSPVGAVRASHALPGSTPVSTARTAAYSSRIAVTIRMSTRRIAGMIGRNREEGQRRAPPHLTERPRCVREQPPIRCPRSGKRAGRPPPRS